MTTTDTADAAVVARYRHPQGSTIEVLSNDAVVKRDPTGKVKSTSATAAKLRAGHGGWTLVTDDTATAVSTPAPARVTAPATTLLPMKFREAPVADLPAYVTDPAWVLQQKCDGVRAQLVCVDGERPWFRNGTGGELANSAALGTARQVLARMGAHLGMGLTIDGEIVDGAFWAFDLIVDGGERQTLADRLDTLRIWHHALVRQGLADLVRLLPTARTLDDKQRLAEAVLTQGGEGWIAKRVDGGYDWGQRVTHSVKLKVTSTVDVVVTGVGRDGKASVDLGLYDDGGQCVSVGRASTIGKGNPQVGDVLEVRYLYAGANGRLVQPTILRVRTDKPAHACSTDQLRMVNKGVIEA